MGEMIKLTSMAFWRGMYATSIMLAAFFILSKSVRGENWGEAPTKSSRLAWRKNALSQRPVEYRSENGKRTYLSYYDEMSGRLAIVRVVDEKGVELGEWSSEKFSPRNISVRADGLFALIEYSERDATGREYLDKGLIIDQSGNAKGTYISDAPFSVTKWVLFKGKHGVLIESLARDGSLNHVIYDMTMNVIQRISRLAWTIPSGDGRFFVGFNADGAIEKWDFETGTKTILPEKFGFRIIDKTLGGRKTKWIENDNHLGRPTAITEKGNLISVDTSTGKVYRISALGFKEIGALGKNEFLASRLGSRKRLMLDVVDRKSLGKKTKEITSTFAADEE